MLRMDGTRGRPFRPTKRPDPAGAPPFRGRFPGSSPRSSPTTIPQAFHATSTRRSISGWTFAYFRVIGTSPARRYSGTNAETHGDKQKAFDRVYAALLALHLRAVKEGRPANAQ